MTFDDYQKAATTFALKTFDDPLLQNSVWVMGIAGEAGEVVEKWKKALAYRQGQFNDQEFADVIWYIAVLADSLGLSLDELMQDNIAKLKSRQARGVIKGSGDNR